MPAFVFRIPLILSKSKAARRAPAIGKHTLGNPYKFLGTKVDELSDAFSALESLQHFIAIAVVSSD
jgi:hypothetical protein